MRFAKYRGEDEMDAMDFLPMFREKLKLLEMDDKLMNRSVNEGFSGGEKKRNEILQMAVLEPRLAILDETDSGLDIDALRIVAKGVNAMRSTDRAMLVVTHYQRLLELHRSGFCSCAGGWTHRALGRTGIGARTRRDGLRLDGNQTFSCLSRGISGDYCARTLHSYLESFSEFEGTAVGQGTCHGYGSFAAKPSPISAKLAFLRLTMKTGDLPMSLQFRERVSPEAGCAITITPQQLKSWRVGGSRLPTCVSRWTTLHRNYRCLSKLENVKVAGLANELSSNPKFDRTAFRALR